MKPIPGYEGLYSIDEVGNVTSHKLNINKVLNINIDRIGYLRVGLRKDKIQKTIRIHQLMAMTYLNHTPDGTHKVVVDHINNIRTDNRIENLQLISNRENASKDRKGGSSKYVGVSWQKNRNKWTSYITINNKKKHLGYFTNELEASKAYQNALNNL